jgi:thiamine biosynthesis lipoprotein
MKSRCVDVRRARPLLGTLVEIAVSGLTEGKAHRAIDAAFARVEEVQGRMSFHDPESVLTQLNRTAHHAPVSVDAWTFSVLKTAEEIWRISGGAFDVTMGPRSRSADVSFGAERASFAQVELLPRRRLRFHHPNVRLDLGGIAKGFAVDSAISVLHERGVPRAIVNAGGDLCAYGEAFPVSIRHPRELGSALTSFALKDSALATSAPDRPEHFFAAGAAGLGHDPQTGKRASRILSATVRARSAMIADALTKVVMLLGERALPTLSHFGADAIFVAADCEVLCSPGWHAAFPLSS